MKEGVHVAGRARVLPLALSKRQRHPHPQLHGETLPEESSRVTNRRKASLYELPTNSGYSSLALWKGGAGREQAGFRRRTGEWQGGMLNNKKHYAPLRARVQQHGHSIGRSVALRGAQDARGAHKRYDHLEGTAKGGRARGRG